MFTSSFVVLILGVYLKYLIHRGIINIPNFENVSIEPEGNV